MNNAVVTTKIDPQTKLQAMKTADELGMPLSVVIKAFLKQFIRTKSVSFSAQEEDLKAGKASPTFNNGEDAEQPSS